jgi:hypothetical protein
MSLLKSYMMQPAWLFWYASKRYTLQPKKRIMFFFFKTLFCVLRIDFLQQCFGIELKLHTRMSYRILNKDLKKKKNQSHAINWVSFRWRSSQYLLWPPCIANTVLHLFVKLRIKFCIPTCGILCHSCYNDWLSWSSNWCGGWRWRTCRSSSSQRCSMGLKSGNFEEHSNTLMLFWVKKFRVILAVWGRTLSCWHISTCRSITLRMRGC